MVVLWTFREPALGHHVHRELLRSVLLDLTPIIAATACHQSNYVERYSRSKNRRELSIVALSVQGVSRCKPTGLDEVLKTCSECA
jgi:hypothetical protein